MYLHKNPGPKYYSRFLPASLRNRQIKKTNKVEMQARHTAFSASEMKFAPLSPCNVVMSRTLATPLFRRLIAFTS